MLSSLARYVYTGIIFPPDWLNMYDDNEKILSSEAKSIRLEKSVYTRIENRQLASDICNQSG